jgi:hypothetical protein
MLSASNIWLLIKALIAITPWLVTAIQSGRVRAASQKELRDAILQDMDQRIAEAQAARDADDLSDPYMPDELRKRLREK